MQVIGTDCHDALVALLIHKRKRKGLRQSDLAALLREYQSWVGRLESGDRRIDVCEFLHLAKALGFDPGKAVSKLFRDHFSR